MIIVVYHSHNWHVIVIVIIVNQMPIVFHLIIPYCSVMINIILICSSYQEGMIRMMLRMIISTVNDELYKRGINSGE